MDKEYSVTINGETVLFEFKDSLIHREGGAAGNIDAIITTTPTLPQELLLDELHIKIPGNNEYLYIYGYGVVENSLKATFNSSNIVDSEKLPEMVEVYWGANGEQLIGEMNCRVYSEKIETELSGDIEETGVSESDRATMDKTKVKEEAEIGEGKNDLFENSILLNRSIVFGATFLLIILILYFYI